MLASNFRDAPDEQARISSLLRLIPTGSSVLEIGARDGYITRLLAERFAEVIALDLQQPSIDASGVTCVAGDVRSLQFPKNRFDVVLCSEVLEHVPPADLQSACSELARVARHIVVGVPFEQDLRVARTRCQRCGTVNPPYGHVNRFGKARLEALFSPLRAVAIDYVARTREGTNAVSDVLMRLAGYPWGTYDQDEPCINCGAPIGPAPQRSIVDKVLSYGAIRINRALAGTRPTRAKWLHMVFAKDS